MKIAEVYIDTNIGTDRSYEYLVPETVKVGDVVDLSFGYRKSKGIVTRIKDEADFKGKLKKITNIDKKKSLNVDQLRLSFFIKDKFKLPLYRTTTFFPAPTGSSAEEVFYRLNKDQNLRGKNQVLVRDRLKKGPATFEDLKKEIPNLTKSTLRRLNELEVVEEKRETKKQNVPFLDDLPEIPKNAFIKITDKEKLARLVFNEAQKLSGQILVVFPSKLKARDFSEYLKDLGLYPTLYLNDLPKREKEDLIDNVAAGNYRIVVGTHSSAFLPFKDLNEIIVAETGDLNYYSNEATKYNLVEVVEEISSLWDKKVIYTDYVDSVLSLYKKRNGSWQELDLFGLPNLKVEYVNNESGLISDNFLSRKLDTYLKGATSAEKVYIVLNRISLKDVPYCNRCGRSLKCPECNAFLQLDKEENEVFCSRCGYKAKKFEECPECGSERISYNDVGRPRLKEILKESFDQKNIKDASDEDVASADIIIGTVNQLKHLGLDDIKKILAVSIDSELSSQNFLNGERVLRNYSQVLETYPNAEMIVQSNAYNNSFYSGLAEFDDLFLTQDLKFREDSNLPPFSDLYLFTFKSDKPLLADKDSITLINRIRNRFDQADRLIIELPYQVKDRDGSILTKFTIKDPKRVGFSEFLSQMIDEGEIKALNSSLQLLVNPPSVL